MPMRALIGYPGLKRFNSAERVELPIYISDEPVDDEDEEESLPGWTETDGQVAAARLTYDYVLIFDEKYVEYDAVHTMDSRVVEEGGGVLRCSAVGSAFKARLMFRCLTEGDTEFVSELQTGGTPLKYRGDRVVYHCDGEQEYMTLDMESVNWPPPLLVTLLASASKQRADMNLDLSIEITDDPVLLGGSGRNSVPSKTKPYERSHTHWDFHLFFPTPDLVYAGLTTPGFPAPERTVQIPGSPPVFPAGHKRLSWRQLRHDQGGRTGLGLTMSFHRGVPRSLVRAHIVSPGGDPLGPGALAVWLPVTHPSLQRLRGSKSSSAPTSRPDRPLPDRKSPDRPRDRKPKA